MRGIVADNNVRGQVSYLVARMQAAPWRDFWRDLHLELLQLEDVGLDATASDLVVWQRCQAESLALITGNRPLSGPDSLEATIRMHNTADCLPVFTLADARNVETSRAYTDAIVESLLDYLQRIDEVRGTGRLYLP